jgi:phenylacetic acid degradation operon negative regulatory protein
MAQERKAAGVLAKADAAALLERPLSPRSLIGSLLLGMRPPRMPAGRLVEWCAIFGVAEGTARVALSRMVERGELASFDGIYELAGPLRQRQPAQDWSLAPELHAWNGEWLLGVVRAGSRSAGERSALREAGRHLRMVELREGLWTRPDNLPRAASPADAWQIADSQCEWWRARPDADGVATSAQLFAVEAWAERARMLEGRLVSSTSAVASGDGTAIADAFVVGAAALAHVRADPLLPAELCGKQWPGDALRVAYLEYQSAFGNAVRGWFRSQ